MDRSGSSLPRSPHKLVRPSPSFVSVFDLSRIAFAEWPSIAKFSRNVAFHQLPTEPSAGDTAQDLRDVVHRLCRLRASVGHADSPRVQLDETQFHWQITATCRQLRQESLRLLGSMTVLADDTPKQPDHKDAEGNMHWHQSIPAYYRDHIKTITIHEHHCGFDMSLFPTLQLVQILAPGSLTCPLQSRQQLKDQLSLVCGVSCGLVNRRAFECEYFRRKWPDDRLNGRGQLVDLQMIVQCNLCTDMGWAALRLADDSLSQTSIRQAFLPGDQEGPAVHLVSFAYSSHSFPMSLMM